MGNYILDLEEGRLWAEQKGDEADKAKKTVEVRRRSLNYYYGDDDDDDNDGVNQYNTIDWEVTFYLDREKPGEGWTFTQQPAWSVILPKTDLSRTMVKREFEGEPNIETLKVNDRKNDSYGANKPDFTYWGTSHRWGYINYPEPTDKDEMSHKYWFDREFYNRYRAKLLDTESDNNINQWRAQGRLSEVIISNEARGQAASSHTNKEYKYIKLLITTYHTKDTILENVPLLAQLQTQTGYKSRVAGIGPFGIAHNHEIRVPKRVYVDDIDHITDSDLQRILSSIHEDRDAIIAGVSDKDRAKYQKEENEAREEFTDNNTMYVRTYSDGSKLRLPLKRFVRQRQLHVIKQYNEVNWRDSVDIALGVNDPGFPNRLVAIPADGNFPDGLYWDQSLATEDVPNGKILGVPKVDWSKVSGTPGRKQVSFQFNIALRKEDGSINRRSETYKPITIVVKQDMGAVPVGVGAFPSSPFIILAVISAVGIVLSCWHGRRQRYLK